MASRLLSLVVWTVVLASAAFWGLNVFARAQPLPPQAQAPAPSLPGLGDLSRLLGQDAPEEAEGEPALASESDRFVLLGVVAPRGASHSAQGVALIAVDGEPAKAWRTGATLVDGVVLLAVEKRSVKLGPPGGPVSTELSLPEPSESRAPSVAAPGGPRLAGGPPAVGLAGGTQGARPAPSQVRPGHQAQAIQAAGQDSGDDDEE